jgi:hypothetical protein
MHQAYLPDASDYAIVRKWREDKSGVLPVYRPNPMRQVVRVVEPGQEEVEAVVGKVKDRKAAIVVIWPIHQAHLGRQSRHQPSAGRKL